LSASAHDFEALVEVAVGAVVGISHVEIRSLIEKISPEDYLRGRASESPLNFLTVFSGHHRDDVLLVEEVGVRKDAEGTWFAVTGSV
jgi:hypothetical protein